MRFYMYHPTEDPDGRIFDTDNVSSQELEGQGWVDNPAKFGYSPTGQASAEYLTREKDLHMRTDVVPEGEKSRAELAAENADLQRKLAEAAEREEYYKSLRNDPDLARQIELDREETADDVADAVRGRAKGTVVDPKPDPEEGHDDNPEPTTPAEEASEAGQENPDPAEGGQSEGPKFDGGGFDGELPDAGE